MSASKIYLSIAAPLWIFAIWVSFYQQLPLISSWGSDFWEHAAVLQTWMQDLSNPGSPHVNSDESSARYMPFYFIISLVSSSLSLNAIDAMGLAGAINISILIIAIPYFSNTYYLNKHAASIALIIFFFAWGAAWKWSNVYQLSDLFYVISFPSFFVFSASFLAFGVLIRFLRENNSSVISLVLICTLSALLFSSHPLTGAVSLMAMGLMSLLEHNTSFKRRGLALIAIGCGSLLVELWPYFSTWNVVLGANTNSSSGWMANATSTAIETRLTNRLQHPFYQPLEIIISIGPAIFSLFFISKYLQKKQHAFIIVSLFITLSIYIGNIFFTIPLGHRFLLFSVFFMHLLLIAIVLDLLKQKNYKRTFTIVFLIGISLSNTILSIGEIMGYSLRPDLSIHYHDFDKENIPEHMRELSKYTTSNSIIIGAESLSWPIPAFKGKVVSNFHKNPLIHDDAERLHDKSTFFAANTTSNERDSILKKYQVSHIFFNPELLPTSTLDYLHKIEGQTHKVNKFSLVSLKKTDL